MKESLLQYKFLIKAVALFCLSFCGTSLLFAGAIRDDVADEKYKALGNEKQFDSVGLILRDDQPYASCVLISPEWILTAGHVVGDTSADRFVVQFGAEKFKIKQFVVNSKYQTGILGLGIDLALFRLDKPLNSIKSAILNTGLNEKGLTATSVGFGRSGTGKTVITNPTAVGTKRAGQNIIESIGGIIDGRKYPDNLLIADFDFPNNETLNRLGDAKPLDLEYCPIGGDSGGGLFIQEKEKWILVGIASGVSVRINDNKDYGIYGSIIYWTKVSLYQDWINEVIKAKCGN